MLAPPPSSPARYSPESHRGRGHERKEGVVELAVVASRLSDAQEVHGVPVRQAFQGRDNGGVQWSPARRMCSSRSQRGR